jgi:hypothetical protein
MARDELMVGSVKRVFPEFLEALSENVFPYFCKLANTGYDFDLIVCAPSGSQYESLTEDSGLKQALSNWAQKFNAESEWLMDQAVCTLSDWQRVPEWREALRWSSSFSGRPSGATGKTFEFAFVRWETEGQTWSKYVESLRAEFEIELMKYEEKTRKIAESCGLVRAQRKYSPENLDWFVLYQFAGRSTTDIARDLAKNGTQHGNKADPASTVLKGIKAAQELVGWARLRESRRRSRKIG